MINHNLQSILRTSSSVVGNRKFLTNPSINIKRIRTFQKCSYSQLNNNKNTLNLSSPRPRIHPQGLSNLSYSKGLGILTGSSRSYSLWPFGRSSTPSAPPPQEPIETIPPPPVEPIPPPPPLPPIQDPVIETVSSNVSAAQELAALELEHGFLAGYTSGVIEKVLCSIHDQTGLPWYLTIPLVIVTLRTALIPVNIWSMRIGANNMRVKPQMDIEIAQIRELQARGEQHKALEKQNYLRSLMKTEGFRPFAPLGLPLVQGSLFVSFFWALREMGNHHLGSLATEGALWFNDLTVAGPWYGLPLIASGLTLLSIETAAEMGGLKAGQSQKVMWFLRAVIVGTLWLFHNLPSAVFLYWCTNNMFSLFWGTFVRLAPDSLKSKLKIPDTRKINNELKNPSEGGLLKRPGFLDGIRATISKPETETGPTKDGRVVYGGDVSKNFGGGSGLDYKPKVWKKENFKGRRSVDSSSKNKKLKN